MSIPCSPPDSQPTPGRVYLLGRKLDDWLDQRNREQHRPANSWHASKLGTTCLRQLWYDRLGIDPESWINPQYSRDGDAGTALHNVYQDYIDAITVGCEREVPIPANPHGIGGRVDIIVSGPIPRFVGEGRLGMIELKTMRTLHWSGMPSHYKFKSYFAQIQIYLALRPDIDKALLVCINRDDSRIKEFVIERDEDWGNYYLNRAHYLQCCLDLDVLPDGEVSKLCDWCPYQIRCEADDMRELSVNEESDANSG